MKNNDPIPTLKARYRRLAARVAALGPVLQGTISERVIKREDAGRPAKKKSYGPYYQWTRKKKGKTVTVNLSPSQAKVYQRAIDRHRELEVTLEQMRHLSLELLEKTTKGVAKRKSH